jgi:hypothetical protein
MANWEQTLDLTEEMNDYEQNEDAESFGKHASARIVEFIETHQSWADRNDITIALEDISDGLSCADDVAEVDYLLADLYDLADNARIWVKTF